MTPQGRFLSHHDCGTTWLEWTQKRRMTIVRGRNITTAQLELARTRRMTTSRDLGIKITSLWAKAESTMVTTIVATSPLTTLVCSHPDKRRES